MEKYSSTRMFGESDLTCIDDYSLPALIPAFYKINKDETPILDIRADLIIKSKVFDDILTKLNVTSIKTVYEIIENVRLQRLILINDKILMTLVCGLGDTDNAEKERKRSLMEFEGLHEEDDELVLYEPDSKVTQTFDSFKFIISIMAAYPPDQKEFMDKFFTEYDKHKYSVIKPRPDDAVYTIGESKSGLILLKHAINTKAYPLDIVKNNYNDDFQNAYSQLTDFLSSETSGLVLLKGKPGTGKSSILIHLTSLASKLNVKFVFVPTAFISVLNDPSFLTFAVRSLKNAVLILEDAESVLISRQKQSNSAVTNILNLSDGILSKLVNLKIIATINKEEELDFALIRKGRLKIEYTFKLLEVDKANQLLSKLNINSTVTEATSLADVYNFKSQPTLNKEVRKKIGF